MLTTTPYHRLARTPGNRWWKTLLGFVLAPALWMAIIFAGSVAFFLPAFIAGKEEPDAGPLAEFGLDIGLIALMLPVVLVTVWWTQSRRPGTVSSVRGRLRWRWLLVCTGLAVVATLLSFGLTVALAALTDADTGTDVEWAGWSQFLPALLVVFALVPLQAAAEEYLCRGWLLQSVGAFVPVRWVAIGVQALVFALLHGIGTGWGFADLVVFGVVTGWLAIRTGGLEAGIALHVVGNLLAFGLTVATVGGLSTDETAADSGWQLAVVDIAVIAAYGLVVRLLAPRLRVETSAPRETERGPVLTSRSSFAELSSSSGR